MKWTHLSIVSVLFSTVPVAATPPVMPPAPLPIFLRIGFSSVLEFEDAPARVVLGDSQAFQVEKLDKSLVLRTLVAYATTNLFVYFNGGQPRLFVLTASEEAEPTYFKKIEIQKLPMPAKTPTRAPAIQTVPKKSEVLSASFDTKKDYLTVEVQIAADSTAVFHPDWALVRLRHETTTQAPFKLWSERKEVQKDSAVRARFIFAKPNIPKDLAGTVLVIPLDGRLTPLNLPLKRGT